MHYIKIFKKRNTFENLRHCEPVRRLVWQSPSSRCFLTGERIAASALGLLAMTMANKKTRSDERVF